MKTAGIIAEYNPFHNGHKYHIEKTRELTGADYVIVIMSGDFVQRGEPALLDKYLRTKMALLNGADLVLELPVLYSCAGAGDFAAAGVSMLDRLGIVDFLSFGSECGDVSLLRAAADVLSAEPESFSRTLQEHLKKGASFPKARAEAFFSAVSMEGSTPDAAFFSCPNNILGMEYCRALTAQNSSIKPVTFSRLGDGYHDPLTACPDRKSAQLPSASGIRQALLDSCKDPAAAKERIFPGLPENLHAFWNRILPEQDFLFPDDFTKELRHCLLLQDSVSLQAYADVNRELADKLANTAGRFLSWSQLCDQLKSKEITYTRISRALTHILLGLTREELLHFRSNGYVSYARILGFQKSAAPLLSAIDKQTDIPLISKLADAWRLLPERSFSMLQKDVRAAHIRESALAAKKGTIPQHEYTRQIVIL